MFSLVLCATPAMFSSVRCVLIGSNLFLVATDAVLCFGSWFLCLRGGVCYSVVGLFLVGGRLCSDTLMPSRFRPSNLSVSCLSYAVVGLMGQRPF